MVKFILDNFDTIFRDEKSFETFDKMILDLAVRGKLVPQIEEEEPASKLLEKIKEEKERLITEKVIKKEKPLPPIIEDEKPYNIPNSWEWVRLGDVIQVINGTTYNKKNVKLTKEKNYGFVIRGGNIQKDTFVDVHDNTFIPKALIREEQYIKIGDTLMVSSSGTLTSVGKSIYVFEKMLDTTIGAFLIILRPKIFKSSKFFHIYLKIIRNKIISDLQGTSISNIKRTVLENYLITLPPLDEQERIVKKVEKLQELSKKFKEIYNSNEKTRANLKKSILEEVEKSDTNNELLISLEKLFGNFEKVIKTKEDVKDIRNLVLSLAVRGKLVPQIEDEEPASKLLQRIKEEKERLIVEKVIKKEKPLSPITEDEKPYDIPESWEWVRLGNIFIFENGDRSKRYPNDSQIVESGVPFISTKNINNSIINLVENQLKFITNEKFKELSSGKLKNKDILICLRGSVGKLGIFYESEKYKTGFINAQLLIMRLIKKYNPEYYLLYFSSSFFKENCINKSTGSAQLQISATELYQCQIPVPPLEEQERIVKRVDELMAVCDALESKIEIGEKINQKLLESLLK